MNIHIKFHRPHHAKRAHSLARSLESHLVHGMIVLLIVADIVIVIVHLLLEAHYPVDLTDHELPACRQHVPHSVHVAEDALLYTSVTILCIFLFEMSLKMVCFGPISWLKNPLHLLDFCVVLASLISELTLHGSDRIAVSLLVAVRLWKIVRIMHAVIEATTEPLHAKNEELTAEVNALKAVIENMDRLVTPQMLSSEESVTLRPTHSMIARVEEALETRHSNDKLLSPESAQNAVDIDDRRHVEMEDDEDYTEMTNPY
eukprot:PhM_4_TR12341/c0_g1_i1/m.68819